MISRPDLKEAVWEKQVIEAMNTEYGRKSLKVVLEHYFMQRKQFSRMMAITATEHIVKSCSDVYDVYWTILEWLNKHVKGNDKLNTCHYWYINKLHRVWDMMYQAADKSLFRSYINN